VKCEPQTAVAQPWDARVNASVFEFRIEVGQDRRGSGFVLEPIDTDLDEVAAQLHAPLHPIDELPMDQFRRLSLVGRPEVMPEVVDHMEGEEAQRQHGLDGVEMQGRQVVHPQEGILSEKVFDTPPCGVGRHSDGGSQGVGGRDQREVRAIAPLLQEHPQRAIEVGHGRVDGRHVAPDGLVILLQGDRIKLLEAFGRRLDWGQDRNAILRVEFLDQLPAVPLFVCNHEEVPSEDVARQVGQPVGDLGDGGAGVCSQSNQGFLGRLVLGVEGAERFAIAVFLRDEGVLHRLARVCLNVVAIDVDRVSWRDLAACDETPPQRGLELQGVLDGDGLEETVLGGGRWKKGEAGEEAEVGATDGIDRPDTGGVTEDRLEDKAQGEARLRQAFVLGWSQRCGEVVGAQLEQIGDKKEPASAGRGQPACKQSGDVMRDVVAGDDT